MIDLHCHILPGIDDGATDLSVSIEMAKAFAADGVTIAACTPHILPGLYHNEGPEIRQVTAELQQVLDQEGISLKLVTGADNHITPTFVKELRSGHLLSLADTRYVLVEPPHHVAPPRLEDLFFELLVAGYVPILTHPERLTWINSHYEMLQRLANTGCGCSSPPALWLAPSAEMRDTGLSECLMRDMRIFWPLTLMTWADGLRT